MKGLLKPSSLAIAEYWNFMNNVGSRLRVVSNFEVVRWLFASKLGGKNLMTTYQFHCASHMDFGGVLYYYALWDACHNLDTGTDSLSARSCTRCHHFVSFHPEKLEQKYLILATWKIIFRVPTYTEAQYCQYKNISENNGAE